MTDACGWCGSTHAGSCPRIKAIDYYPDGTTKRVEFRDREDDPRRLFYMKTILGGKSAERDDAWLLQKQLRQTSTSQTCSFILTSRPSEVLHWARDRGWTQASLSRGTYIAPNGDVAKVTTSLTELIGLPVGTKLYLGPGYHEVTDYSVVMEHAAAHRLKIVDA